MADFHLVLELPDKAINENPAYWKLCDQYVILRLIVAGHRYGARLISVVGQHDQVAHARQLIAHDYRLVDLDISWGTVADSTLPTVRGPADAAIGKVAWERLAQATAAATLPGYPEWTRSGDGTPRPLWTETGQKGCYAIKLTSRADLKRAKQEIFANITKSTSGPVSRYLNARLSIPLSKFLVETPMTPNQMTITNTFVGIGSALLFAVGTVWSVAAGGIVFQLSAALDRNDGELARAKFMESEKGAWIDTVGDNITYVAFMICLTIGYSRFSETRQLPWHDWVLPLGLGTIGLTIGLIGWMFWYVKSQELGGTMTAISRQFESQADTQKGNRVFAWLSRLRVLGERDQFSLAVMGVAIMPAITGNHGWFSGLFFTTVAVVIVMNLYFVIGRRAIG